MKRHFDISVKIDNINLNTKVKLSDDNEERLKKKVREHLGEIILMYNDIEDVDNAIKYQVMYDFIMQLSRNDEFWNGDDFIYKEKLSSVFMSGSWKIGLA